MFECIISSVLLARTRISSACYSCSHEPVSCQFFFLDHFSPSLPSGYYILMVQHTLATLFDVSVDVCGSHQTFLTYRKKKKRVVLLFEIPSPPHVGLETNRESCFDTSIKLAEQKQQFAGPNKAKVISVQRSAG